MQHNAWHKDVLIHMRLAVVISWSQKAVLSLL